MDTTRFIRCLFTLMFAWLVGISPCAAQAGSEAAPPLTGQQRVLFILGSAKVHGTSTLPASISFDEVVNAWDVFHAAGYAVDYVSPDGGAVPILDGYVGPSVQARLQDARIMDGLRNTARPAQVDPSRYQAVYYVGGSNAMYGVAENPTLQKISMQVYEGNGGVVSAVCHGTAGIVNLTLAGGRPLVSGRRITGYPEQYEQQDAAYFKQFPFLIRQTVEARGGLFQVMDNDQSHVEVDGRVVTGQNFSSAGKVAEAVVAVLEQRREYQAVDRTMQTMLRGFSSGDPNIIFEVLRRDGVVLGYAQARSQVVSESTEEWAKGFPGEPAADEAQRKRSYRILDVDGAAALVKLTLHYPMWDGVDYLSLSKIDGEWMIVSKSWSGKRKAVATQ